MVPCDIFEELKVFSFQKRSRSWYWSFSKKYTFRTSVNNQKVLMYYLKKPNKKDKNRTFRNRKSKAFLFVGGNENFRIC